VDALFVDVCFKVASELDGVAPVDVYFVVHAPATGVVPNVA